MQHVARVSTAHLFETRVHVSLDLLCLSVKIGPLASACGTSAARRSEAGSKRRAAWLTCWRIVLSRFFNFGMSSSFFSALGHRSTKRLPSRS